MKCAKCGCSESKVIDSRPSEDFTVIRRRRECLECKLRFTTYERIELSPVLVVKKDGTREAYDRDKIIRGILKSCEKRPVSMSQIEAIVSEIETELMSTHQSEIASKDIGEAVMAKLRTVDEVAYVRFASVYRQFKDLNTFLEELTRMLSDAGQK
ncbi:MAG: transcriptional regulator NrdR [Eubacteriaceae bacterium]|nr:transcriptional regulator NrdR [Eubacteriaceae bacterium]